MHNTSPEQVAEQGGEVACGEKGDAVREQPTARSILDGSRSLHAPPGRDDSLDEHARGLVAHGELDRPALFRAINDGDRIAERRCGRSHSSVAGSRGPARPAASPDPPCRPGASAC